MNVTTRSFSRTSHRIIRLAYDKMVLRKYYCWTLVLIFYLLLLDALPKEGNDEVEEHRMVFQTLYPEELATGKLLCYGECKVNKDKQTDSTRKPVYTYDPICLGRLILLSCKNTPGKRIRINSAFVGRHSPEGNTCLETLECPVNVTEDFQKKCNHKKNCDYEFGKSFLLNDGCAGGRGVKDLAFDIRFQCVNKTNNFEELTTTSTTITTDMAASTAPQITTTDDQYSPSPILILRTFETQPPQTHLSLTPFSKGVNRDGGREKSSFFWLLTVYKWMTDERFMSEHKVHMALAIILSIFVGLVVSLFFILDHSRRSKAKKAKRRASQRDRESIKEQEEGEGTDGEDNHLISADNIPMVTLNNKYPNGCLKKPKLDHPDAALSNIVDLPPKYQEEDDGDNRGGAVFGECQVLIENNKRFTEGGNSEAESNGGKNFDSGLQVGVMSDRKISHLMDGSPTLTHLPPPPRELLENHSPPPSISPVHEFIPPPREFQEIENSFPSLVVTSPDTTKTGSLASKKDSGFETPKRVARPCLKSPHQQNSPNISHEKKVRYPSKVDVINGDFQQIEKSVLKRSESTCSDRVLSSEKRMTENNDFMYASHQMDMINNRSKSMVLPSKSSRYKSKRNDSPVFQTRPTSKSADKLTMKPTSNKTVSNRNQRKGKLHVIATSKDYQHLHDVDDSEGYPMKDDYMTKQRFLEIDGDSFTQQETEETFIESVRSDDNSVLINEHSEQEQPVSIEESGYQSRESDSFCSSNRSTDCEDCHIFKTNHVRTIGSTRLQRERSFKREPALNNVKVLAKVARRMRYENTRTAQQQNELRPSESSMEETSSRDSVNIPRTRMKPRRRDGPVFENNITKKLIENNRKNPAYYSDPDTPKRMQILNNNGSIHTE